MLVGTRGDDRSKRWRRSVRMERRLKVQKADVHGKGESSGGGSGGGSGCVAMFGRADEAVAR